MRYWIYSAGEIDGPVELEKLGGRPGFGPASLVCPENSSGEADGDWKLASSVAEIAQLLATMQAAGEPRKPNAPQQATGTPDEEINSFLKNFGFSQEDIELASSYGDDAPAAQAAPSATAAEGDERWLSSEAAAELASTGKKISSTFSTIERLRRAEQRQAAKPPRFLGEVEPPWIKELELNEKLQKLAAESSHFAVDEEDEGEESFEQEQGQQRQPAQHRRANSPAFAETARDIETTGYGELPQEPADDAGQQQPVQRYYAEPQQTQPYPLEQSATQPETAQADMPALEEEIIAPPQEQNSEEISSLLQEPAEQELAAPQELEVELRPPASQKFPKQQPSRQAVSAQEAQPAPIPAKQQFTVVQQPEEAQPEPEAQKPAPVKSQAAASSKFTVINQMPLPQREEEPKPAPKPEPEPEPQPAAPAAHIEEIHVTPQAHISDTGPQSLLNTQPAPSMSAPQQADQQQVPLSAQRHMQQEAQSMAAKATSASYTIQMGSNMSEGINVVGTGGTDTVTVADIAASAPPADPKAIISGGMRTSDPGKATFNAAAMMGSARATADQTKRSEKKKSSTHIILAVAAAMLVVGIAGAYFVLRQDGVGIGSLLHGNKNKARTGSEKTLFAKDTSTATVTAETPAVTPVVTPGQNSAQPKPATTQKNASQPAPATPAGPAEATVPTQSQQITAAVTIAKNYQLDGGRGMVSSWLKNSYTAKNGIEDWSANKLNGDRYVVQYRFLRVRQEPIVYLFEVDVKTGKITRGINNQALELLGNLSSTAPARQPALSKQTTAAVNTPVATAPAPQPDPAPAVTAPAKPVKPLRKKKVKSKAITQLPLPEDPNPQSERKGLSLQDDTDLP